MAVVTDNSCFRHSLDFNDNTFAEEWKVYIPKESHEKVVCECHDDATAGHLGIANTISRLARFYYWPKLFADACDYVRYFANCQKFKSQQEVPVGTMYINNVENP